MHLNHNPNHKSKHSLNASPSRDYFNHSPYTHTDTYHIGCLLMRLLLMRSFRATRLVLKMFKTYFSTRLKCLSCFLFCFYRALFLSSLAVAFYLLLFISTPSCLSPRISFIIMLFFVGLMLFFYIHIFKRYDILDTLCSFPDPFNQTAPAGYLFSGVDLGTGGGDCNSM